MTMTARSKICIDLNNLGVQLLEKGKYAHAAIVFRTALDRLIGKLPHDQCASFEPLAKRRRMGEAPTNSYETSQARSIQEENAFVYCHAFRIMPWSPADANTPCQESFARDAAVIMYNLAMVKHLYYMASSELPENSEPLSKALYLYRMVHAIVVLDENKSLKEDPYFRLVMMATCNNLAQIRFSLGQFQEASASMTGLASLLLVSPNVQSRVKLVSKEDMAGFHMNLLLLVTPTLASAA